MLDQTPGLRFFLPGKSKDGWWSFEQMEKQCKDMLDAIEMTEGDIQAVIEADYSAGHARQQADGLNVADMNVKYGGKQKALCNTTITQGCLGPGEAKMYFADGKWSTRPSEGAQEFDLKLQPGDTQCMSFAPNAPPPFYDCDAPREDVYETELERDKRERKQSGWCS